MTGGFSYCGVDIGSIGLEYAPEMEETYVYRAAAPRIHEETFDGHDGGYYYGSSLEPKEFKLRCFFEEQQIDKGVIAKVMKLFREGRSGKLIFSRRPWCYYYATVTELDLTQFTNYLNGIIQITMKAYYPYARSEMIVAGRQHEDYYRLSANAAFLERMDMIPSETIREDTNITQAKTFLLLNPGNAPAATGIEIAGNVGQGVTITNHTTGQHCSFVAMSSSVFDGETSYVYLDGLNGKCMTVKGNQKTMSFLYHDEGFISLAPAFPLRRHLSVYAINKTATVLGKLFDRNSGETLDTAEEDLVGKYIWLDNKWCEITGVGKDESPLGESEHILQLAEDVSEGLSPNTVICKMNKLTIEPVSTMDISRLNFIYKPTFY